VLSMSAVMKFVRPPQVTNEFVGRFGYPESTLPVIGLLELACAVLYALPRTAVLGAVLLTGYLGGAIATHVRIGDPAFVGALLLPLFAWGGLYLREQRLRALLPIRR
jgi:DoxX-like family